LHSPELRHSPEGFVAETSKILAGIIARIRKKAERARRQAGLKLMNYRINPD
jgi:hypothetical protein